MNSRAYAHSAFLGRMCSVYSSISFIRVFRSRGVEVPWWEELEERRCSVGPEESCDDDMEKVGFEVAER